MSENKKDSENEVKKTGHIYDGIEELDHAPPTWFNALFLVTVFFGIAYFFYYSLGDGPTVTQEYERAKDAEEYARYQDAAKNGVRKTLGEDELKALIKDPKRTKLGADAFQGKCISCHGAAGQGGIGPNLTDNYWIHGAKMTQVLATITNGVPEKGMPPWGAILNADEIQNLTVYIKTIAGSKPPGAKTPQGVLIQSE